MSWDLIGSREAREMAHALIEGAVTHDQTAAWAVIDRAPDMHPLSAINVACHCASLAKRLAEYVAGRTGVPVAEVIEVLFRDDEINLLELTLAETPALD